MSFNIVKVTRLGESSTATTGTQTLYTVGSGKSAKVKLMWAYEASATSTLLIRVDSKEIYYQATANEDSLTGVAFGAGATPGIIEATGLIVSSNPIGYYVCELPNTYYLDATDTVQYTIGTAAATNMWMVVQGTEFNV